MDNITNDIFVDMIRKYAKVKYTVTETNVYGVECSKIEIVFEKPIYVDSTNQYYEWFEKYLLPLVRRKEINKQIESNLNGYYKKNITSNPYYPSNANIYKGGHYNEKKNKK